MRAEAKGRAGRALSLLFRSSAHLDRISMAPIDSLPPELIIYIIQRALLPTPPSYSTFTARSGLLRSLALVSKAWTEIAQAELLANAQVNTAEQLAMLEATIERKEMLSVRTLRVGDGGRALHGDLVMELLAKARTKEIWLHSVNGLVLEGLAACSGTSLPAPRVMSLTPSRSQASKSYIASSAPLWNRTTAALLHPSTITTPPPLSVPSISTAANFQPTLPPSLTSQPSPSKILNSLSPSPTQTSLPSPPNPNDSAPGSSISRPSFSPSPLIQQPTSTSASCTISTSSVTSVSSTSATPPSSPTGLNCSTTSPPRCTSSESLIPGSKLSNSPK